jgi:hypothetical protein
MENTLGKRKIFSLRGLNPSAGPTREGKLARFSSPLCPLLPCGPECQYGPPVGHSLSVWAPPVTGFFPQISHAARAPLHHRGSTAAAHPSGRLSTCRCCCRAASPVHTAISCLVSLAHLSCPIRCQRATAITAMPGAERLMTSPAQCLAAEPSARTRVGCLLTGRVAHVSHSVATSAQHLPPAHRG